MKDEACHAAFYEGQWIFVKTGECTGEVRCAQCDDKLMTFDLNPRDPDLEKV
jgi:hypothetical protein